MLNVEFIFDKDCPNVKSTRANLMKAFSKAKLSAQWKEWDRNSEEAPEHAKIHGSPTVLINGKAIRIGRNITFNMGYKIKLCRG